jgi:hypothetical protein
MRINIIMNKTTRKPWLQSISVLLIGVACVSIPVIASAAPSDSTQSVNRQDIVAAKPQIVPDTTQCVAANMNQHIWVAQNTTQVDPWKSSTCPEGYMPYQLQSFMNVNGVGVASGGVMDFRYYCCKTKEVFAN